MKTKRTSGMVLVAAALTVLTASRCPATPSITSVIGSPVHGGSITVSGSGFGTKSSAQPIIWDDFESGTSGQTVHGKPPVIGPNWDSYTSHGVPPKYSSTANRANSSLCSMHDFVTNSQYNCSLEYWGTHSAVYFTFWWKYVKLQDYYNRNTKPWIEYGVKDGYCPLAYIGFGNPDYGDGGVRSSVQDVPNPTSPTLWGGTSISSINDQWIRIDQYLEQSSPNVANGTFMTWIHKPYAGSPAITFDLNSGENQYMTRTRSYEWLQWHFGSYFAHDTDPYGGGLYAEAYYYIDDIYFDTTRSRVEIGNAATWNSCTHREIQVSSAWSSNSIAVTVNQGTFTGGQQGYLYVVDADGNANASGYPVTIGDVSFTLTVTNGSGSGEYDEGEVVAISADAAPSGKAFAAWVGDFEYVADRLQADTTVTMPATDVSLTAVYVWAYQLTVNSGTGDGQYPAGTVVDIEADPAPTDKEFACWTGDTANVADVNDPSTTVAMPSAAVEITATYTDILYTLTVNSGTGGGAYLQSTVVPIAAGAAPGCESFMVWIGDTDYVADPTLAGTTVTMPASAVEVTATYGFYRGDVNQDGFVGGTDLDYILGDWGHSGTEIVNPIADINGDSFVGGTDLDYVLGDWGKGACPPGP